MPFFTEILWFWFDDSSTLNYELDCDAMKGKEGFTIEERINSNSKISACRLNEIANNIFKTSNVSVVVLGETSQFMKK